jgi:hypothetical protein
MPQFRVVSCLRNVSCLIVAAVLAACGGGRGTGTAGGTVNATSTVASTGASTVAGTGASTAPGSGASAAPSAAASAADFVKEPEVAYDSNRIPAGAPGAFTEKIQLTGHMGVSADIGAFRIVCDYSHMAPDDPIVSPNQPGRSHLHTFFGNTGTNAYSTADSIANSGGSTCMGGTANRSAYWIPSLIDTRTGTPIKPSTALIYYKTGYNGVQPWQVQSMPPGLRMIAGDAKNDQPDGPYKFVCIGQGSEAMVGQQIQNCPVGAQMWQLIFFPQCWDGMNLDSPDHKSHMSYPVGGACPKTHPVPLPEVSYNVVYDVTEANAPLSWRLSSDTYDSTKPGGYSSHGDWFNGWNQDVMKAFVKNCDQASMDCHANLLGDGRELM